MTDYKNTLNLPQTDFPMRANLATIWRDPAVQRDAKTNRRQQDIQAEVNWLPEEDLRYVCTELDIPPSKMMALAIRMMYCARSAVMSDSI